MKRITFFLPHLPYLQMYLPVACVIFFQWGILIIPKTKPTLCIEIDAKCFLLYHLSSCWLIPISIQISLPSLKQEPFLGLMTHVYLPIWLSYWQANSDGMLSSPLTCPFLLHLYWTSSRVMSVAPPESFHFDNAITLEPHNSWLRGPVPCIVRCLSTSLIFHWVAVAPSQL